MAVDNPVFVSGLRAGGNLSANDYTLVKIHSANNQVVVTTNALDYPVGVRYPGDDSAAGDAVNIAGFAVGRWVKVKVAAGGVTRGSKVGGDSAGLLVDKSADKAFYIGVVAKSWVSGDYAEVLCAPGYFSVT